MKKILALLFIVLSFSSFAGYRLSSFRRYYLSSSGSVTYSADVKFTSLVISNDFDSVIFPLVYNNSTYFKVNTLNNVLTNPSQVTTLNSTPSIDRPLTVISNDVSYCAPLFLFAPKTYSLYLFCNAYFRANPESTAFTPYSGGLVGFYPREVLQEILFSTNSVLVSSFLSELSKINTSVSSLSPTLSSISDLVDVNGYILSDILDYVSGFAGPLKSKPFTEQIEAYSKLAGSYVGGISPGELQSIKDTYNSLADSDTLAAARYADSVLSGLRQASDFIALNKALSQIGPTAFDAVSGVGSQFNQGLKNSVDAGFSSSAHIQGATTNILQRMSTNWVQETKAALSNNTQKIKDDLAAWKNQLNDSQSSIANSTANINTTLNNIAGGSSVVHVTVDNNDIGVTITDPVTIDPTQFNSFSEDLGKAGDYMESLYNEFKYWAWQSPDGWKTGFLDGFLHTLIPKVEQEVSLQHSISNLLADFVFNYTNKTEFAISNALAGFTFSSTNDYLLLSDYADYISTSGLSDLLGFMVDDSYLDLNDELSSIGANDVSAGYGRWWRYYTGLSTIQANSVFKIANLLIDHEKLLKDLKRENTDVVELSDSNVFSELLSKIPTQTHIDNKISELTNSIDQSGFARIRELIPDLTNRLSVASALYDHDFALPTDISWVLIPADSDLNIRERVIHISPSEHYRVFQVLHYGIAFSYCIVNLILLPKFLLLLVRLFDRVWNKSERLIYNSTQS